MKKPKKCFYKPVFVFFSFFQLDPDCYNRPCYVDQVCVPFGVLSNAQTCIQFGEKFKFYRINASIIFLHALNL